MDDDMKSTEYELLTERLMRLIVERATVVTTRLEHNVRKLPGRGTSHQIDVLWELVATDGSPRRVIIECRRHKYPLKQKDVFAFSGVVRDLDTPELPTIGVMVTTTGYQSGAQAVADTYGVVILQLREPTSGDVENRLMQIVVRTDVRTPVIEPDVNIHAVEMFAEEPRTATDASEFALLKKGGGRILLQDFLWAGVLGSFDEPPVAPRRVTREFDPPAVLTLRGEPLARITSVAATVGEVQMETDPFVVGGGPMAWMIANVLDSTRVWFTDTDRTYVSDDQEGGVVLATDVILGRSEQDPTS
jgi:hypothetical protein